MVLILEVFLDSVRKDVAFWNFLVLLQNSKLCVCSLLSIELPAALLKMQLEIKVCYSCWKYLGAFVLKVIAGAKWLKLFIAKKCSAFKVRRFPQSISSQQFVYFFWHRNPARQNADAAQSKVWHSSWPTSQLAPISPAKKVKRSVKAIIIRPVSLKAKALSPRYTHTHRLQVREERERECADREGTELLGQHRQHTVSQCQSSQTLSLVQYTRAIPFGSTPRTTRLRRRRPPLALFLLVNGEGMTVNEYKETACATPEDVDADGVSALQNAPHQDSENLLGRVLAGETHFSKVCLHPR